MNNSMPDFLQTFLNITKKPYEFLSVQDEVAIHIKDLIKKLYDYTKLNEDHSDKHTLPQLIVDEFDDEQIWQQLELQNGSCTDDVIETVSQLSAKKDKLQFPLKLKCIIKETEGTNKSNTIKKEDFENLISPNNDSEDDEEEEERTVIDGIFAKDNERNIPKKGKKVKPSIVDDKFFKLSELELFLQNEERNQDKPGVEKETFDLFDNTDEGASDYKYSDFFVNPEDEPPVEENNSVVENVEDLEEGSDNEDNGSGDDNKKSVSGNETKRKHEENYDDLSEDKDRDEKGGKNKRVRFSLLDSDNEEISSEQDSNAESKDLFAGTKKSDTKDGETKSTFEKRQERLGYVIKKLEEQAISEKPWQMSGEVSANARPQNSLLEEAVDFDVSVRPAPVITGEVSLKLEDIITQRIKDKAWDDVERKVKPVDTPSEFKKKLALDQEKSKLSLAEVYEQEFIKQREAATADDTDRQETEPALHVEVRSMLHSLFNKLDALSNYHYTPRPVAPEVKIISNVAAINMEEVAPVTVADSALLAPEEIKGKTRRRDLISKEERTDTDKKRARRLKRTRQRRRQREKAKAAKEIEKMNLGLGNKYSKLKAEKQLFDVSNNNVTKMEESKEKIVKSSTSFFNKLQDEVRSQIKSKTTLTKKKNKRNVTAKQLKL